MVVSKSNESEPIGFQELDKIAQSVDNAIEEEVVNMVDRLSVFLSKHISSDVIDRLETVKHNTGQYTRQYDLDDIAKGRWSEAVDRLGDDQNGLEEMLYYAREAIWDIENRSAGEDQYDDINRGAIKELVEKLIEIFYFEHSQGSLDL